MFFVYTKNLCNQEMFTGLIHHVFTIDVDLNTKTVILYADEAFLEYVKRGDSIAINGTCLTVVDISLESGLCTFHITDETISKTTFSSNGKRLANVELSLNYGTPIGGHIVSGHVFQTGTVTSLSSDGCLWIDCDTIVQNHTFYKDSIAIDGVSLTVAEIRDRAIRIALIPETLKRTTIGSFIAGQKVNVEYNQTTMHLSMLGMSQGEVLSDSYFMKKAIEIGENGRVSAPPNPWVGCVVVRNSVIVGAGFHSLSGGPHAEVEALSKLIKDEDETFIRECTLYTTLEPCCHHGRTPPCTDFLIGCGIGRIVVGVVDPDVRVSGMGIEILRKSAIPVDLMSDIDAMCHENVKYSLRHYLHFRQTGLPYCTIKMALSYDGCYKRKGDRITHITHQKSREFAHRERSQSQAIVVGAVTAQCDNPQLTVRYGIQTIKQPLRIVFDGKSLTSQNLNLFTDGNRTMIVTQMKDKWHHLPDHIEIVYDDMGRVSSVTNLVKMLGEMGIMHVMVEGGKKIHKSFMESGLVNEILVFRNTECFGKDGSKWIDLSKTNLSLVEHKTLTCPEDNGNINFVERFTTKPIERKDEGHYELSDIGDAVQHFADGGMVIVLDDEDRENEGDLMVAASKMTHEQMAQMIKDSSGIVCAPIELVTARKLKLELMCSYNTDNHGTAFTVSVDSVLTTTGVSARDRLATVRCLADECSTPGQLRRPGHVFPLLARSGGLAERAGHTEAAIALCKLADVYPRVAVIGELQNKDGTMKRRQQCYSYAQKNGIPMITIQQLKMISGNRMQLLAECNLLSKIGDDEWKVMCFDSGKKNYPHKVFMYPKTGVNTDDTIPVRIHSECFTGDVFKSRHCDCGEQLENAMKHIVRSSSGIIIFPYGHEGRGIGFVEKIKAYKIQQESNLNTFQANEELHLPIDARTYDAARHILLFLGVNKVLLLSENPEKIDALGDIVVETMRVNTEHDCRNEKYLKDKRDAFDHMSSMSSTASVAETSCSRHDANQMAKKRPNVEIDDPKIGSLKIAIVYASWHDSYIVRMRQIIKTALGECGVSIIDEYQVPGSFEVPYKASIIAPEYDGIVCVGILMKGETLHFENVSASVSHGIMQAQIATKTPMANSVLSCLDFNQLEERISGKHCTLDYIARTIVQMALTNQP